MAEAEGSCGDGKRVPVARNVAETRGCCDGKRAAVAAVAEAGRRAYSSDRGGGEDKKKAPLSGRLKVSQLKLII